MSDYVYIQSYSKKGKLGISRRVFEQIAIEAVNRVTGASYDKKRQKMMPFNLFKPISVILHHTGNIDIRVEITIKKGNDIKETCEMIQKEIRYSLESMVEQAKVNIVTRVIRIEK